MIDMMPEEATHKKYDWAYLVIWMHIHISACGDVS